MSEPRSEPRRINAVFVTDRTQPTCSLTSMVDRAVYDAVDALANKRDMRKGRVAGRLLAGILRRPKLVDELLAEEARS